MGGRIGERVAAAFLLAAVLLGSSGPAHADTSTGRRVLGTFLGSVDGALVARALTLEEERNSRIAILYLTAVGGGAAIGYATAGNDDALTALGILLIPLGIINLVLPDTRMTLGDAGLDGGKLPGIGGPALEGSRGPALRIPRAPRSRAHAPLGAVDGGDPDGTPGGLRVTALHLKF